MKLPKVGGIEMKIYREIRTRIKNNIYLAWYCSVRTPERFGRNSSIKIKKKIKLPLN